MTTTIGGMLPAEPRIVRFLDTVWADRDGRHDDLDTPKKASTMLTQLGFEGSAFTEADASKLQKLRDALRRLAAHRTGDDRQRAEPPVALEDAIALVNRHASRPVAGPTITVHGETFSLTSVGRRSLPELLGELARDGIELVTGDTPLRACLAPSCVLYYVQDHPRRGWCSTACGNRARAARHYARTKTQPKVNE